MFFAVSAQPVRQGIHLPFSSGASEDDGRAEVGRPLGSEGRRTSPNAYRLSVWYLLRSSRSSSGVGSEPAKTEA